MSVYDTEEYKREIKRTVSYEWWVEFWDKWDDIQECEHVELKYSHRYPEQEGVEMKMVLKRYYGSPADGVIDSGYAYVVDGALPTHFDTGQVVPKQYIEQYKKFEVENGKSAQKNKDVS